MIEQYLAPEICAKCGGKCCNRMPGEAVPDNIIRLFGGTLEQALKAAFDSGDWVIDWWEGDPRPAKDELYQGYYVRPRAINDAAGLYNPSWGGQCSFLIGDHCKLAPEERPQACRLLEPKEDGCVMHEPGGKREAALAWLSNHDMIIRTAQFPAGGNGGKE